MAISKGSALICGVGKDAAYLLSEIKNRSVAATTDHPYVHELERSNIY